jgi:hypothetical protein
MSQSVGISSACGVSVVSVAVKEWGKLYPTLVVVDVKRKLALVYAANAVALVRFSQRNYHLNHRFPINYPSRMLMSSCIFCQQRRTGSRLILASIAQSDVLV